ncbi:MAG TPA: PA0069 family radical SAM protein [Luteolibacter sp.]|nr:PA0069 family radical SAM protein [Luteolibacter sp.]
MPARGRGADGNPPNRFEQLRVETDEDAWVDDDPRPLRTTFLRDDSQSVLARNDADDISFDYGLNPYRGCEHGCAYCYARIYHEFLGFSAGLDFESKIVVKHDAPELLERELAKTGYRPGVISLSGVTDCYQPVERRLELTRRCLEVLARFRNPVVIITKNTLVTRDLDHLAELARHRAVAVFLSVTTLDSDLARVLEPRAPTPRARLETLRTLADAGIPAGVSAAPMIPGLNDSELAAILTASAEHGATFAAYSLVRLPGAVADVFSGWLDRHRPQAKEKILNRIRSTHGGTLNSGTATRRMRGTGQTAAQWQALFRTLCRKHGLHPRTPPLNLSAFRRCSPGQQELF